MKNYSLFPNNSLCTVAPKKNNQLQGGFFFTDVYQEVKPDIR